MKPVARTDRLIKHVVGQETLVYDPADDTACCLNSLASVVWRHCDGRHSVAEIAEAVQTELGLRDSAEAEEAVLRVLDELEAHHLLVEGTSVLDASIGRRDLVRALALLPLFPAIQQITAPSFATAGSPAPSPTPSTSMAVTPSVTATSVPGVSLSMTPTATPTPMFSMSMTPTPTRTPMYSLSATPTPTPTHT